MKKLTLLIALFIAAVGFSQQEIINNSQQSVETRSIEVLLEKLEQVGDVSGDISEYFSQPEQLLLKNHFAGKKIVTFNSSNVSRSIPGSSFNNTNSSSVRIQNEVAGTATRTASPNNYSVNAVTITHSNTQTIEVGAGITCNGGGIANDNSFFRDFDLDDDFGIVGDFDVTNAEFGIETIDNNFDITVNIYSTTPGTFPGGTLTLQGTATYNGTPGDAGTVVSVPVSATIPAGENLIYELSILGDGVTSFFVGANLDGQTGVSWILAADCGATVPTDLNDFGFANSYVMNVIGDVAGGGGGGSSIAYCSINSSNEFGTFDPTDGSVVTVIGASPAVGFENAGSIDPNDTATAYVLDNGGDFYSIDVASGTYTMLGNIAGDWTAAEFDTNSGILYGIADTNLHTIDIGGVSSTVIGATGLVFPIGLAIDGSGNAYTYDVTDDNFYSIDLGTGAVTLIGSIGFDANFGQGMAWDPGTDTVYMTAFNNGLFDSEWRSVDTATGMTTLINQMDAGGLTQYAWVSIDGGTVTPPPTCTNATYVSTDVPFDIDGAGTSTADCVNAPNLVSVTVSSVGIIGVDANIDNVSLDITHTFDGDLDIYLVSPNGTELELSTDNGGGDDNFTGTIFQDGGADITAGSAPFTGTFEPEGGTFAVAFDGESITGVWSLKVCDDAGGDSGTIDNFTLTICEPAVVDNDLCVDAIAMACGDTAIGDTSDNTDTGGNPATDEWYSFTGTGTPEIVTFSLCDGGTTYDSLLRVFDACGGTEIAVNDDSCGLQSEVSFLSDGTSTYYVMVEGFGSSAGVYSLEVTCAQPPANDECTGAIDIVCGDALEGTTINSSIDTDVAGDCGDATLTSPGVWYVFNDTSGLASNVNVSTCGGITDFDTKISVFTGDCGAPPLTCVDGNDDSPDCTDFQSEVDFVSDGNSTYYILVHSFGGATGDFTLTMTCELIPPPNDDIVNSITIVDCPFTDPAVAMPAATLESGNPAGCNIDGATGVWYNITPAGDGTITATIVSPSGLSHVTFYTAADENASEVDLTLVDQSDNQCLPGTTTTIDVVTGQVYYVFVVNTGGITDISFECDLLSVADNVIEGFSFYPNPSNDVININSQDLIENVSIYNILGQKVIDQTIDATSSQINVANLAQGTYIMKATVNGVTASYKVIKK